MKIEKERLDDSYLPPWVIAEHHERYRFVSGFVKGKVVVDCACGSGVGSKIYARSGAKQVLAFDVDEHVFTEAITKHSEPNLVFSRANAYSLPLQDNVADVFVSLETIEHIEDDDRYLSEICRLLKPDGLLICSTPNRTVTNPGTSLTDRPWNSFHIREYSSSEFVSILKNRFYSLELFGQNCYSPQRITMLNCVASLLVRRAAVRLHQLLKLPRFIFRDSQKHKVQSALELDRCEDIVACCRNPIK